jgi:hypothetical protein
MWYSAQYNYMTPLPKYCEISFILEMRSRYSVRSIVSALLSSPRLLPVGTTAIPGKLFFW